MSGLSATSRWSAQGVGSSRRTADRRRRSHMFRTGTISTLVVLAFALALAVPTGGAAVRFASGAPVREFPLPHAGSRPYTIVTGPDGNLWFTESSRGVIGRITPRGNIKEFKLPDPGSGPYGITVGADGNLWFTERYV